MQKFWVNTSQAKQARDEKDKKDANDMHFKCISGHPSIHPSNEIERERKRESAKKSEYSLFSGLNEVN